MKPIFSLLLVSIFITTIYANEQRDSLFNVLKISDDTNRVLNLYEIGNSFFKDSNLDSAKHYMLIGDSIATEIKYTNGKIKIWRSLGSIYARNGEIQEAHSWLDKGFKLIENEKLPIINKVDYLINKGVVFYFNGEISKALEPYLEATKICREHGFDSKRSMLLNNIGIMFRMLGRHKEALSIYEEAFELRTELKDTMGMGNIMHNLATAYSKVGDFENSLQSVQNARALFSAIDMETDVLLSILSEATVLYDLGRKEEAFRTIAELNSLEKLPFDPEQTFNYHLLSARLFLDRKDVNKALFHTDQIEDKIVNSEFVNYQIEFNKLKAAICESKGDFKSANKYLNRFITATLDKNDVQNAEVLKELETKYLSNEKDQKIILLDTENSLKEAQLLASNQRNYFLLSGLLLFGLLSFIMYKLYKDIKLKNKLIEQSNEEKETLLKEIHHRVKNNLQVISALLNLQSRYIKDDKALEAIREGHDRVQSMALIHKDLYQHDNLKGVNTKDYFEKLIENLFYSYKIQEEEIELQLDIDSMWLDVDTMIPLGLMINELLSNALKHAFEDQSNGLLHVSLKERSGYLELIIKDNGKGVEDIEGMKDKSFGYSLIQSFSKRLDANIEYIHEGGLELKLIINDYDKVA